MTKKTSPNSVIGRRALLKAAGLGAVAVAGSGLVAREATATAADAAKMLAQKTGGAAMQQGKVTLKLPEIAENGSTVPLTVSVDSPMTADNHVKAIHVVAEGNPNPEVCSFHLTPGCGKAEVATRVRLGKTQNVTVAAVMSDGKVFTGKREVKVTIGGCGG